MNLVVRSAAYNETAKARFKKEAMSLLRKVVRILELPRATYNIRYNPAGVACSGDATLHADRFYVSFNLDFMDAVLVRKCKGQSDYIGGPNRWYSFQRLANEGADGLAEFIKSVVDNP